MTKRRIEIPYGSGKLSFELPEENILAIAEPRDAKPARSVDDEIGLALANPVECAPISSLVGPGKKVAIISDDYTRPTPTKQIVPAILKELERAGVRKDDVTIVVAAGIHRDMTAEELEAKFGREVLSTVRVVLHRAADKTQLSYLGRTKRGTPVWINKQVLAADVKIGVGTVEAHPYAGFGGGAKIVMPGVAGEETIFHNHGALAKEDSSWFGRTRGNPCWEDIVEVARMAGLSMVVNVVVTPRQELVKAFAGEPVAAQARAIKTFLSIYGVPVPHRADIVIASANPKHWYFDQSNLAMLNAVNIVKDGGTRIIAAYCPEVLGPPIIRRLYEESLGRPWPDPEVYLEEMKRGLYNYEMADAPAIYKLIRAERKAQMILVSEGVGEEEARKLHLNWTRSMDEALHRTFAKHGESASVIVLPLGGMSLPYVAEQL